MEVQLRDAPAPYVARAGRAEKASGEVRAAAPSHALSAARRAALLAQSCSSCTAKSDPAEESE